MISSGASTFTGNRAETKRSAIHKALFFVRWQLIPVAVSLPSHLAFVFRGLRGSRAKPLQRLKLAWLSASIHLKLECGHNPEEVLRVLEEIVELPPEAPGVVVECGAFLGGSSAKLSHAVSMTGRKLLVCDSFEGLPIVGTANHISDKPNFKSGEYAGRLPDVAANIERFGKIDCVEFIQGWYEETLGQLAGIPIACAFWDVDLRESFLSCIEALWPQIASGAKVFLHDVDRQPVAAVFEDADWWEKQFDCDPPKFVGARVGLGRLSPLMGYVIK